MTWIDERLFGWSRSAKHGTSAWGGSTEDISRAGTPDGTDDEDTGDYENVIGFIPAYEDQPNLAHNSRSRQSSYADLQRLRVSTFPPVCPSIPPLSSQPSSASSTSISSAFERDELHLPSIHTGRDWRGSLSDRVPVERVAALDHQELFVDATHGLNDKIRQKKSEHGA